MQIPEKFQGHWQGLVYQKNRVNPYQADIVLREDGIETTYHMRTRIMQGVLFDDEITEDHLLFREIDGSWRGTLMVTVDNKGDLKCKWRSVSGNCEATLQRSDSIRATIEPAMVARNPTIAHEPERMMLHALLSKPLTRKRRSFAGSLKSYFSDRDLTVKALDRYQRFAIDRDWRVGLPDGKLWLYRRGQMAFDAATSSPVAEAAFREAYETVRSWPGVQRPNPLAPANEVFNAIRTHGRDLVGHSNINLANLRHPSSASHEVIRLLPELRFIKAASYYPWMPVTKMLHFCNPSLFPIWDRAVVWKEVMWEGGPFRQEFDSFSRALGINPTTNEPEFVLYYTLWAASYIQGADSDFMTWFAEWMDRHYRADLLATQMDQHVNKLYSTAFEFVAIGAAYLEAGT